jgi:E3 ubiquitin-protein ligase TRIP12
MVSIHAIATFKALDDYLRPRISLAERPGRVSRREGLSSALAALAAAGLPNPYAGVPGPSGFQSRLADRGPPSASTTTPSAPAPPSRSARKSKSKVVPNSTPAGQSSSSTPQEKEKMARRSARRLAALGEPATPSVPPPEEDSLTRALECADEQPDDDEDELDASAEMDAIVGDIEDEMEEGLVAPPPEPAAVNLEVATGGKVTAHREDGTRVGTPSQAPGGAQRTISALAAAAQAAHRTPSGSRPMSYADAIQAIPQDWHIEFSLDNKTIPNETTIYRAVHSTSGLVEEHTSRSVWSAIHPINFKRVPGPPPAEPSSLTQTTEVATETTASGIPASLDKHPATSSILRLLNILHALNANLDDVLAENKDTLKLNAEPPSQFVNTKLTAKLNRQLEEPLIVASNCLPSWSEG